MEPNASDPLPGSVMAQAPTFSRVSSGGTNSSCCASVPLRSMAPAVSPMLTPSAVTMPGLCRQSSMIGMSCIAIASAEPAWKPSRSFFSRTSPFFLRSRSARNFPFAMSPMPKVLSILRSTS